MHMLVIGLMCFGMPLAALAELPGKITQSMKQADAHFQAFRNHQLIARNTNELKEARKVLDRAFGRLADALKLYRRSENALSAGQKEEFLAWFLSHWQRLCVSDGKHMVWNVRDKPTAAACRAVLK